jgi:hypothetical protein
VIHAVDDCLTQTVAHCRDRNHCHLPAFTCARACARVRYAMSPVATVREQCANSSAQMCESIGTSAAI